MVSFVDPSDALKLVESGDRLYVGSNCAHPQTLTKALYDRREELTNVEIYHLLVSGETQYTLPECAGNLRHIAFFFARNTRPSSYSRQSDYLPVFLHEIPRLFDSGSIPVDVALISVSPPNEEGFVSLGLSVDLARSACRNAKTIIAEVNEEMPFTCGDSQIHLDDIAAFIKSQHPIPEHHAEQPDEVSRAIATHVNGLIKDGDCLQIGIGKIPEAVLQLLQDRNDLGIHTELIGDGVIELYKKGNITGRFKTVKSGVIVAAFALASRTLFNAVHLNDDIEFHPSEFVNDPFVIGTIPNMVAINGAIQIDLTGQVVSDSIGHKIYSGVGGQVDFVRGASRSPGGRPIIVLPSTAKGGSVSRLVSELTPGAGVVTSRADVHWVATEYGIVNLHGMPIQKRAAALIELAHPTFRDQLRSEAKRLKLIG